MYVMVIVLTKTNLRFGDHIIMPEPSQQQQVTFRVPDSLHARCSRLAGWDDAMCVAVLEAYRQFMELKVQHEDWDATILFPPQQVDIMWRQHILDVKHYTKACN
jgi:hypothetical protein